MEGRWVTIGPTYGWQIELVSDGADMTQDTERSKEALRKLPVTAGSDRALTKRLKL